MITSSPVRRRLDLLGLTQILTVTSAATDPSGALDTPPPRLDRAQPPGMTPIDLEKSCPTHVTHSGSAHRRIPERDTRTLALPTNRNTHICASVVRRTFVAT